MSESAARQTAIKVLRAMGLGAYFVQILCAICLRYQAICPRLGCKQTINLAPYIVNTFIDKNILRFGFLSVKLSILFQ